MKQIDVEERKAIELLSAVGGDIDVALKMYKRYVKPKVPESEEPRGLIFSFGAFPLSALSAMFNWLKLALSASPTITQADPVYVVLEEREDSDKLYVLGVVRDIESAVFIVAKMKESFKKRSGAFKNNCKVVEDEEGATWFGAVRKGEYACFYRVYIELAPLYEGVLSMDTFEVVTMNEAKAKLP
jgi:hypothetical protein